MTVSPFTIVFYITANLLKKTRILYSVTLSILITFTTHRVGFVASLRTITDLEPC